MSKLRGCFISYEHNDRTAEQLVRKVIEPAFEATNWVWNKPQEHLDREPIFNRIATSIRHADLVIADVSTRNANVLYELGMAHGWGKRSLLFSRSIETVPFDLAARFPLLKYSRSTLSSMELFEEVAFFLEEAHLIPRTLADPALRRHVSISESISVELCRPEVGAVHSLRFASAIAGQLEKIGDLSDATLAEVRLGSFGAWISSNIRSVTELVEKIVFFIPEWRKKNAERIVIEAEAELLLARAERERSEARSVDKAADRQDLELLMDIIRDSGTPVRVTFGEQLQIETHRDGQMVIGLPVGRRGHKPQ